MSQTSAGLTAFVCYLAFVCLFLVLAKNADILKSYTLDMIAAYREAAQRGDVTGKFLFAALLIIKVGFKAAAWTFFLTGFAIVSMFVAAGPTTDNKPNVITIIRSIIDRLYSLISDIVQSTKGVARPPD